MDNIEKQDTLPKKNILLIILCFLTFAGSGFGFVVGILSVVDISLISFTEHVPGYTSVSKHISDAPFLYSLIKILLYAISIYAAYLMLIRRRSGFWMYAFVQIVLPLLSFLFFPYTLFQIFLIVLPEYIFGIAFIGLYALQYREFSRKV